jgi:hypothetical protein
MMHFCKVLRVFGFLPTLDTNLYEPELTYYYDSLNQQRLQEYMSPLHPQAHEKLLLAELNTGSDFEVYGRGIATIPGLLS